MNKAFKFLLYLLSLTLIIVPAIYVYILFNSSKSAFNQSFSNSEQRNSSLREAKVNASKDPVSILFLGIDDSESRRENGQSIENSRTDAMILSTLNPDKKKIRLLSIPRDTLSFIPEVGYYDKITHAHVHGGPNASMESVEATLNVPVDYYVRINMEAFADAVNELGGIEYNVPYDLNEPNTMDKGRIILKKGKQQLNGDEVLALARTRKQDSDLARGQRQMDILKALFQKAQKTDSLNKIDDIIEIVGDNAKHNLSFKEIQGLALTYLANDVEIESQQLAGDNELLDGIYYINPDIEDILKTSNVLRRDLDLPEIDNSDELLDQRVVNMFGEIPPLYEIPETLLDNNIQSNNDEENNEDTGYNETTQDNQQDNFNDGQDPASQGDQVPQDNQQPGVNNQPNANQPANNDAAFY
ncbi:LCP family protein [Staphylococcus sp. 11261D007BR]